MVHSNIIELEISGQSAMFTDPESGGSFPVPTFEAVKGILRAVYWKPTFIWVPDELRVMNRISMEDYSVMRRGKCVVQRRLADIRWQVRAHFVWNDNRPEFARDRDEDKHFRIALRSLARGGRFPVWLGTADCPGEVRPARFGSSGGYYDGSGAVDFGVMYHGVNYPDEGWNEFTRTTVSRRKWHCVMNDGVIRFLPPEKCSAEFVRTACAKRFNSTDTEVGACAAGKQD